MHSAAHAAPGHRRVSAANVWGLIGTALETRRNIKQVPEELRQG